LLAGTVRNCVVTNNRARAGGGIICQYHGRLENCLVAGNAAEQGGGVSCSQYSVVQNCTIVGNRASAAGGGLDGFLGGLVRNCVVWSNDAPRGANVHTVESDANRTAFAFTCADPAPPGEGNVAADPRFVNPAAGDYRLAPGSPCIDAGTADEAPSADLLSVSRPQDGDTNGVAQVDLGAYEFVP
jgi:hypothetical protein